MDVLVIGSREHALAWRLARDGDVRRVRIAPGNGGRPPWATTSTSTSPTRSRSRDMRP